DGRVANAGLAGPGLADFNLLPLEDLRAAGLVQADGSGHGVSSFQPSKDSQRSQQHDNGEPAAPATPPNPCYSPAPRSAPRPREDYQRHLHVVRTRTARKDVLGLA